MAFITSESVAVRVLEILKGRMAKWEWDGRDLRGLPKVRGFSHHDFHAPSAAGDGTRVVVGVESRRSDRAEQDTGEYAEFSLSVRLYLDAAQREEKGYRVILTFGDLILLTLEKEARARDPRDGEEIDGLFRLEPEGYNVGTEIETGPWVAEIPVRVLVDSSEAYAI